MSRWALPVGAGEVLVSVLVHFCFELAADSEGEHARMNIPRARSEKDLPPTHPPTTHTPTIHPPFLLPPRDSPVFHQSNERCAVLVGG